MKLHINVTFTKEIAIVNRECACAFCEEIELDRRFSNRLEKVIEDTNKIEKATCAFQLIHKDGNSEYIGFFSTGMYSIGENTVTFQRFTKKALSDLIDAINTEIDKRDN